MIKYGIYIPLASVILFSLWDLFTGGPGGWVDQLLTNALVIGLGCQLLGFAVGHLFKADAIAEHIGWKKGSPFQLEVGIADLTIGIFMRLVFRRFSAGNRYRGHHLALGVCGRPCPGHDAEPELFTGQRRIRLLLGTPVPRVPDRTAVPDSLVHRI